VQGTDNVSWVEVIFESLARAASEHPILIGTVLIVATISTALHAITFAGHLLLGLSQYLRQQMSEVRNLARLLRRERDRWRRQTEDMHQVESMSAQQIADELERHGVDPTQISQLVMAFTAAWLRDRTEQSGDTEERDS
jgi:hypothetical protein